MPNYSHFMMLLKNLKLIKVRFITNLALLRQISLRQHFLRLVSKICLNTHHNSTHWQGVENGLAQHRSNMMPFGAPKSSEKFRAAFKQFQAQVTDKSSETDTSGKGNSGPP